MIYLPECICWSKSCLYDLTTTQKDLHRWSSSLENVLDSPGPEARKKFCIFLSARKFDEAEITLKFWESCNRIVLEAMHDDRIRYK